MLPKQGRAEVTQEAEKPNIDTVREKAAQGLDKLTDAELQVYTEYMQRQVAMSEGLPGYTEKTRNMVREGLADAQAEAQRRTETPAAEAKGEQAEQERYTGSSGTEYSREQADALSGLSSDTLIAGAEAQFTMPIDRLGITEEQADKLRKAGLLATETTEDGDTFEYLPDTYIFDERSRRFDQQSKERAQKAAGDNGRVSPTAQIETNQDGGERTEIEKAETPTGTNEITVDSTEEQRYEILKNQSVAAAEVDNDLLDDVEMESLNGAQKSAVKKTIQKIAKRLGINQIDLKNSKISFPFRFSNTNVGVSTQHQQECGGSYQDFAKVLTCISDLVDKAVLIETHNEKKTGTTKANPDLKQTYVLLGAVKDGDMIIPVQMEVKEFYKNDGGLYMTVALTKVNGSEVISDPTPGKAGAADHLFSDPVYSIRKIIEKVKAADWRFLKYAPDGFLNEEQKAAKKKALQKQTEEYAAYTVDGNGNFNVEGDNTAAADLSQEQKTAENGTGENGPSGTPAPTEQGNGEAARNDSGELEARETAEEAKKDLLEVGEGKVKNDTGEYRMTIRRKRDGHYLASVDFNGKRSQARTFGTAAEAAEWAAGIVDGQTKARQDAELDRHKSKKKNGPTLTQKLFGQFDPDAEAKRQKENRAAEAATQTLREIKTTGTIAVPVVLSDYLNEPSSIMAKSP